MGPKRFGNDLEVESRGGKTDFEIGGNGELHFALNSVFGNILEIEPFHYVHRDRTAKLPKGVVPKV